MYKTLWGGVVRQNVMASYMKGKGKGGGGFQGLEIVGKVTV